MPCPGCPRGQRLPQSRTPRVNVRRFPVKGTALAICHRRAPSALFRPAQWRRRPLLQKPGDPPGPLFVVVGDTAERPWRGFLRFLQ